MQSACKIHSRCRLGEAFASSERDMTGAPDKVRTRDPLITNQVLYQLSYKGIPVSGDVPDSEAV
jgi:hypothetical protein